ncbi:MAG TPA: GGDEF domain-containing protein [Tepidiformaceae bacterium]|nr:GGDEF domain-containing protein [Tepidiformaceae bacterium]
MTTSPTVGAATEVANAAEASRRHTRTETILALLQAALACAFGLAAFAGIFEIDSPARELCVGAIWIYHFVLTAYAFAFRVRGESLPWVEPLLPIFDLACVSAVFIAIGDPVSPVWAGYLFVLTVYSRRYQGASYAIVALYTLTSLIIAWLAIGNPHGAQFAIMLVMAAACAAGSYVISEAWRDAEARVRSFAETDPLTGVANRRTFFSHIERINLRPLAILMFDLDHFKRLNDELGHQAGDRALQDAARAIESCLPPAALLGRYGGEEFIAAIPAIDAEPLKAVAESIRAAIELATPTTASIGTTFLRPRETLDDAVRRADQLLFVAKRSGRNQVVAEDHMRFVA